MPLEVIQSTTGSGHTMYQVQAKQVKRTFKLLVKRTAAGDTQCRNELLEINSPVLVFVEHVEHVICKFCGIAKWEKLLVYPREFGPIQSTRRTILSEPFIPEKGVNGCGYPVNEQTNAVILFCQL